MDLLINVILAWIATISVFLLGIIYILRKVGRKKKEGLLFKWNKSLRKYHKWMGIVALGAGYLHGLYSSFKIVSFNQGTYAWLMIVLLGLGYLLRKKMRGKWAKIHRGMAAIVWALIILHLVEVGGFVGIDGLVYALEREGYIQSEDQSSNTDESNLQSSIKSKNEIGEDDTKDSEANEVIEEVNKAIKWDGLVLEDGTYTGVADGYGPDLTTSVVVEGGKVVSVEVLSHNEKKEQFWGTPVEVIPELIVDKESAQVDAISGATYTSYGIMMSVQNALEGAIISGTQDMITMPTIIRGRGNH